MQCITNAIVARGYISNNLVQEAQIVSGESLMIYFLLSVKTCFYRDLLRWVAMAFLLNI